MNQPKLILFCGLPGAGKTTTAKRLEKQIDAIRICTDEWMHDLSINLFDEAIRDKLQARLYELSKELLAAGFSVILEDGLWGRSERDQKLTDGHNLNAFVEIYYFDLTKEKLWSRLQKRNKDVVPGIVPITEAQFKTYVPMFQPMDEAELKQFDKYHIITESSDRL